MSMIDSEYYKVKQALGHRPSRVELFENMDFETYIEIKKNSKENIFKDYIGYLMSIDELDYTEKEEIEGFCWRFIKMIENTRMSKSYKMPFLLAFYNNGELKSRIDDEDLYKSFKEFYSIKENTADMYADKNTEKFAQWGREKYVELARQNPVKYMIKSESEFFELDKDKIVVKRLEEFKDNKFFVDNIKDAIEFRTKEYYKTRYDEVKDMSCIFCDIKEYVLENELAFAIFDKFPVTKGHMLFIPKRHVANFFDLTKEEREAIFDLVDEGKKLLDEKYSPDAYNVGVNVGEYSGQSVMHVHIHLMPRYIGDTKYPKGGVRGVIPEKMSY